MSTKQWKLPGDALRPVPLACVVCNHSISGLTARLDLLVSSNRSPFLLASEPMQSQPPSQQTQLTGSRAAGLSAVTFPELTSRCA